MKNNKYNLVLVVILLAFFPVPLWFFASSPHSRFIDLPTTLASLGQIFGLVGVVLFAVNLILSTRLQIFDRYLNGINDVYLKHGQIGQIAFIFLLLHPLLLISKYATNTKETASFLWLSGDWAKNWGILALGMMIILITLTLYLKPRYDIWKFTHKFLGLAFFLVSLHVWLIPSDISSSPYLRIYILCFIGLGFLAFVYKSLLGRFLVKKYKYTIIQVNHINNLATEIRLRPIGKKLEFTPGQFVFINFIDTNIGFESHPFSFTSSPNDDHISFLIKNLGDYTEKIYELQPGTIAEIEGPFGNFYFKNRLNKSQVWIAGGIGITPFISMAKALPTDNTYKIDLVYCVRNRNEAVFLNILENISSLSKGCFRVIPFYSDDNGHISIKAIEKLSGDIAGKEFLICAPPKMIKNIKKALVLNKVKREHIHSEEFSF